MIRADIFAPKERHAMPAHQLISAINAIEQAHALDNKFGTRVINWNAINWFSASEEGVQVGITKVISSQGRLRGKEVECYILGDSRDRRAEHVFYDRREWRAFVGGVKNDEFELDQAGSLVNLSARSPLQRGSVLPAIQKRAIEAPRPLAIEAAP